MFFETCNYNSITRRLDKKHWIHNADGYHQTPQITVEILERWLGDASLGVVNVFSDCVHVPLSDRLSRCFGVSNSLAGFYPVRVFEAAVGRSLKRVSSDLGDLLFCVAIKN